MTTKTVFYSWQSESAKSRKRIDKAIKKIEKNNNCIKIIYNPTQDSPRSPYIPNEIFKKIDSSDVFVCDLSIVNQYEDRKKEQRYCPNQNVLFELGYALKSLGHANCIILFDDTKYKIENLPFDMRQMRCTLIKSDNFDDNLLEYINMCVPKNMTMKVTDKINDYLMNIYKSPNDVVADGYVNDFKQKVELYLTEQQEKNNNINEISRYLSGIQNFYGHGIIVGLHNRNNTVDDMNIKNVIEINYRKYCCAVRYNINNPQINKMLRHVFYIDN